MRLLIITFLILTFNTFTYTQTILQEGFDLGNLPQNWSLDENAPSNGWEFSTTTNLNSNNVNFPTTNTTFVAASNDDLYDDTTALANTADEDRLITPLLDFSPYNTILLTFDYFQPGFFGSEGSLEMSTDGGNNWTPIQLLTPTATWQNITIDLSAYNNDTLLLAFRHNDNGQWADAFAVDNVHIFAPITDNVSLETLSIDNIVAVGNMLVTGEIENVGTNNITSFDINYAVDGGSIVTDQITNVNIMNGNTSSFVHSIPINFSTAQNYDLKVWTSNVNGNTDGDNSNDTLNTLIQVLSSIPAKNVILEHHTGAWCAQCPDGIAKMAQILNTQPNLIGVTVHNGDAMATNEGGDLTQAFITDFPQGTIDRIAFNDSINIRPSDWQQSVVEQLGARVPVAVSILGGNYAPENRELHVTVQADIFGSLSGDYRFNLWIIEDGVVNLGTGYDQANAFHTQLGHPFFNAGDPIIGFTHDRTLRGMVGGAWGSPNSLPLTMADGEIHTHKFTFVLPQDVDVNKVQVIGIVQRYDDVDLEKRYILNAAEATLLSLTPPLSTDLILNSSIQTINIYPNPTTEQIRLQLELNENANTTVELISLQGQVLQTLSTGFRNKGIHTIHGQIDNKIVNGFYLVRVQANEEVIVRKIAVFNGE